MKTPNKYVEKKRCEDRLLISMVTLVLFLFASAAAMAQSVDSGFGNQPGHFRLTRVDYNETVNDMVIDSQGRILVAYQFEDVTTGEWWPTVIRLTANGTPDITFGFLGVWRETTTPSASEFLQVSIDVDSQDRPFVGWTFGFDQGVPPNTFLNQDFAIRRLTTSGANDLFKVGGFDLGNQKVLDRMVDLIVLPGDRVVALGSAQWSDADFDFGFIAWEPNGVGGLTLDTAFDTDGRRTVPFDLNGAQWDLPMAMILDGANLVAVGHANTAAGTDIAMTRISASTGAYDTAFDADGRANFTYSDLLNGSYPVQIGRGLARTLDGGYVVAGDVDDGVLFYPALMKTTSTGTIDATWGFNGWWLDLIGYPGQLSPATGFLTDVAVAPGGGLGSIGGEITAVGVALHPLVAGESIGVVVRRTNSGAPDPDFSSDGVHTYAFEPSGDTTATRFQAMQLVSGGNRAILAGGMFGVTAGASRTDTDILATRITLVDQPLFTDGFESGSTSAWSSTTP